MKKALIVVSIALCLLSVSLIAQWTVMSTESAGTIIQASDWNNIVNNLNALYNGTALQVNGLVYSEGTISPDQKPTCDADAEGFLFNATDFDRIYRCDGSAWEDLPGQTPRGAVMFFSHSSQTPGTGWQVLDGSSVTISTPTGGTTSITVADYSTAAYIKGKSATNTLGPTAASGSSGSHSHTVDSHSHSDGTYATNDGDNEFIIADTGIEANVSRTIHDHDVTGSSGSASPGTNSQSVGPGTLELRRSELLAYMRL